MPIKRTKHDGGRPLGKIDASLNEKLQSVEWGEYEYNDFFEPITVGRKLTKADLSANGAIPVFSSESANNGIIGYTDYIPDYKVTEQNPVFVIFGDHTRSFNITYKSFSVADNVKILRPKYIKDIKVLLFILSAWKRNIPNKGYARHWNIAKNIKIPLPIKDGQIDFAFMENFVAELEARRIAELEAYLSVTGLKDYTLTDEEIKILNTFNSFEWRPYNLEKLFGKSTRGKRLKSADRIQGDLPFVTAGETYEGISDYIGNEVEIFESNTTTIDMFGSAKYRNFRYGADDHVAVVHTEHLPEHAAIFVTTAIHKSSHTGKFDYSRNFYAKDADELDILLPTKDSKPDYSAMDTFISAIQKLVIKDVVLYSDRKIKATKNIIGDIFNLYGSSL